ncbi:hypothetical protein HPP92_012866 [Vanilla planifolia]|uniref:Uncharacterized protein n=1 Tax=Vanilla planifolia TaxID=51239 RepID=A0A835UXY7_VANPL|nr:hypothetical protein HPP92_012866 [Vanilla planifolia]
MHDLAATALGYGIYKTDFSNTREAFNVVSWILVIATLRLRLWPLRLGQMRVLFLMHLIQIWVVGILMRILEPCKKAVADAGLKVDRLQSVEPIGSGSRIPAITKILSEFFRKEPRRTLNSSECVARGCALQCAMLSPVFKVREYELCDSGKDECLGMTSGRISQENKSVEGFKGKRNEVALIKMNCVENA